MAFKKIDPKETQKLMDAIMAKKDEPFDEEEFNSHIIPSTPEELDKEAEKILNSPHTSVDVSGCNLAKFYEALRLYKGKAFSMTPEEINNIEYPISRQSER